MKFIRRHQQRHFNTCTLASYMPTNATRMPTRTVLLRETVNASADTRESLPINVSDSRSFSFPFLSFQCTYNCAQVILQEQLEGSVVRARELLAAAIARADSVDHVARGEKEAAGDLGVASLAAAERAARVVEIAAGSAVDRAIDAAAAEERRVGGIHNGIDIEARNVAAPM